MDRCQHQAAAARRPAPGLGDDRRSQATRHPLRRVRASVPGHRRNRGDHPAAPAGAAAQRLRLAAGVQPDVHDARHDDDLLRRHAARVRLRELSRPAHDRRAGHGVPAPERFQLLADRVQRAVPLFQLRRRLRPLRRGNGSRRGLVRLRTPDIEDVLAGAQHRLLDARAPRLGIRQHRHRDQHHRHHRLHALPRNDARQDALARLAEPGHGQPRDPGGQPAHRRADHAPRGPVPRWALLRHPGRRFRRPLDALLLGLRPSRGLRARAAGVRFRLRDHPGLLPQGDVRLPGDGRRDGRDRVHQHERVGAPHVHRGNDVGGEHLLRLDHDGDRGADGDQDLQLARYDVGRKDLFQGADAVLHRVPLPVPHRGADRSDDVLRSVRLAARQLLFRGRPFPLRDRRGNPVLHLRGFLLLVPEGHRPDVQRGARETALLALRHRLPPHVRLDARARSARDAPAHLYLRAGTGLGHLELPHHRRRRLPGRRRARVRLQPGPVVRPRTTRGERPLGRMDAGVVHDFAPSRVQLRDGPGGEEPAPAVGPQASRGSRLEIRMSTASANPDWVLPDRGRVGMFSLFASESAIFVIFIVAYLFYAGKSVSGPTASVLHRPVLLTVCLLSSSWTIHRALAALRRGEVGSFARSWVATIVLGAVFLGGTALEWRHLIRDEGLTIRTNLFGTTYYSLVGLHAFHVTVGLIALATVALLTAGGHVRQEHASRVDLLSLYWHFVDVVWIGVFLVVYVVGR